MLHKLAFRAMGCEMAVFLEQETDTPPAILDEVPGWLEDWEQCLSRFRPDSELSRLNRSPDQGVEVSAMFWDVFQTARWADQITGGLVTPTVLDAVVLAGYDRTFETLPLQRTTSLMAGIPEIHSLSLVISEEYTRTISIPAGLHLDFGGVAKGWAAHQTVEKLKHLGPCLMNAGGDIAISGPRPGGQNWTLGISDPFVAGKDLEVLYLKGGGLASSGKDRRYWNQNGIFRHHIIDPLTGEPAQTDVLRVTVVAPTVMEAEAIAKAALILGSEGGMSRIDADPALAALFILDDGRILYSRRLREYL